MSVCILDGGDAAVLYCNTSDWAFGPVFRGVDHAEDFLRWLRERDWREDDPEPICAGINFLPRQDPRSFEDNDLEALYGHWLTERTDDDCELIEKAAPDTTASPITVAVTPGLPGFVMIGVPSARVREVRERVRAAIVNAGFEWPHRRITVHLGSWPHAPLPFDDAEVAVGILAASGQVPEDAELPAGCPLSLDGRELATLREGAAA